MKNYTETNWNDSRNWNITNLKLLWSEWDAACSLKPCETVMFSKVKTEKFWTAFMQGPATGNNKMHFGRDGRYETERELGLFSLATHAVSTDMRCTHTENVIHNCLIMSFMRSSCWRSSINLSSLLGSCGSVKNSVQSHTQTHTQVRQSQVTFSIVEGNHCLLSPVRAPGL